MGQRSTAHCGVSSRIEILCAVVDFLHRIVEEDGLMEALQGLRVLNTRAVERAAELNRLLRAAGATPLPYPCLGMAPVSKIEEFDEVLRNRSFDWIYLRSQNAVELLADRVQVIGMDRERLLASRYAAVGPETVKALKQKLDIDADFVVERFDGESTERDCPLNAGEQILMPVSDQASDESAQLLTAKGGVVTRMVVYRSVIGQGGVDAGTLLKEGKVDAITFMNPTAVTGLVKRLRKEEGNLDDARQVPIACIGPNTRDRAISENMLRAFIPSEQTVHGLVEALSDFMVDRRHRGTLWG